MEEKLLKNINRALKVTLGLLLVFSLFIIYNIYQQKNNDIINYGNLEFPIVVSILIFLFHKRKFYASVILAVYLTLVLILILVENGYTGGMSIFVITIYFVIVGSKSLYKLNQISPVEKDNEIVDQNIKFCAKCGDRNHIANIRCQCGEEF